MSDPTPTDPPTPDDAGGDASHLERPHVRPVQPVGVQKDGKQFVALRDPLQLQPRTMVVPPQVLGVLQHLQGQLTVDEVATRVNAPADQVRGLVASLDELGLLWGPTSERMEKERLAALQAEGVLPSRASTTIGADADEARKRIEGWLDDVEDPELEFAPRAIVAPHLDYPRGWRNYASAYYPLCRGTGPRPERPDRVVVLGTNHFGAGDGAVLSELGLRCPLGDLPADRAVIDALVARTGRALVAEQLDHFAEHSIDLHAPWLHHCFGDVPVVAALVPDPLQPMLADDGERLDHPAFVAVLREVLEEVGGRTFFVSSADLSHVGPQFGEPRPVDDRRAGEVEDRDREMLAKYQQGDVDEFLEAMRWHNNSTRWCSVGNMSAVLSLVAPETIELIDYEQAGDDEGRVLVSSASIALA